MPYRGAQEDLGNPPERACTSRASSTPRAGRSSRCRRNPADPSAFVTFLTAGFPTADSTVPLMLAMEKGGADIIELGVPFSDPSADGPVIQQANTVS